MPPMRRRSRAGGGDGAVCRHHDVLGGAHRGGGADPGRHRGLHAASRSSAALLHADRRHAVRGDGRHRTRRLAARVDPLLRRQHRRVGHDGLLRLAAATRRAARTKPIACRRPAMRSATSAAACCCWSTSRGSCSRRRSALPTRRPPRRRRSSAWRCGGWCFRFRSSARCPSRRSSLDAGERPRGSSLAAAFGRLGRTFREIRRYKHAFLLFIAMLLYQDGIQTIIRMASIYGAEVGIDQTAQIAAFVMVQFLGIPFSFLFGSARRAHRHQAGALHRAGGLHARRRSSATS